MRNRTFALVLAGLVAASACGDDPTDPSGGTFTIEGEVAETTPASVSTTSGPQLAPGTDAEAVSVVYIESDGSYVEIAATEVTAEGTYAVEDIETNQATLAVVAYVGSRVAGEVLVHGEPMGGAVLTPAPITYETTLEARTYAQLLADGELDETSAAELALMLRVQGAAVEATLASEAQIEAIAEGYLEASRAITTVLADAGITFNAAARQDALADAMLDYEADLVAGSSVTAAHDAFVTAAIDAVLDADVSLELYVTALAAATTAFDATLEGRTSIRGRVVSAPVLANMRARRRIISNHTTSSAAVVALVVQSSLAAAQTGIAAATTASALAAAIEAQVQVTGEALVEAVVALLAPGASLAVQNAVAVDAEFAYGAASLNGLLEAVTDGTEAANVVADYEADVRAAVETLVDDSPTPSASVDILTQLFIAAAAAPHIN